MSPNDYLIITGVQIFPNDYLTKPSRYFYSSVT